MNNRKVSAEFDNDEVFNKLDALLHRHKNQVDATGDSDDVIPMLTEVVSLQSTLIQTEAEQSLSLQQVLDAALKEVEISMNTSDRIMLTKALEKRLNKI